MSPTDQLLVIKSGFQVGLRIGQDLECRITSGMIAEMPDKQKISLGKFEKPTYGPDQRPRQIRRIYSCFPHSASRRPEERRMRRATADRNTSSRPQISTRSRARVMAV